MPANKRSAFMARGYQGFAGGSIVEVLVMQKKFKKNVNESLIDQKADKFSGRTSPIQIA